MYRIFIEDVLSKDREVIGGSKTQDLNEVLPIIYQYLEENEIYRSHLFHKVVKKGNEKLRIRLNDSNLYFVVEELLN